MSGAGGVLAGALLLAGAVAIPSEEIAEEEIYNWGRDHCELFYEGEVDALWDNFSEQLQGGIGGRANLVQFYQQVLGQLGEETQVVSETVQSTGGNHQYVRTCRFAAAPQLIQVQWVFDDDGIATGFLVTPVQTEYPSRHLEYQTRTALRVPFDREWHVFWGGRSLSQNYHAYTRDQRFAYDILMMKDGKTHAGDGEDNEDYYCFGKPILCPGDGKVVALANDVVDNEPGVLNPGQALGNHVILDHGNGEFSFLAHFQQGSVAVKVGQEVEAGELLGRCGNSGNTTEAHLHYHLQNSATFGDGDGLPIQFQDYSANGKKVARGEPVKGDNIGPPAGDDE